jgi:hypothetical protein
LPCAATLKGKSGQGCCNAHRVLTVLLYTYYDASSRRG